MTGTNRSTSNDNARLKRVPVSGLRDILTVFGKDDGFEYRFVKDTTEGGSRTMRFKRGGWDYVRPGRDSTIVVGEECVYKSKSGEGSIIRYASGEDWLYLMCIRKEYYDEDQAAKIAEIDQIEDSITGKKSSEDNELGQYGEVKIKRD